MSADLILSQLSALRSDQVAAAATNHYSLSSDEMWSA